MSEAYFFSFTFDRRVSQCGRIERIVSLREMEGVSLKRSSLFNIYLLFIIYYIYYTVVALKVSLAMTTSISLLNGLAR